MVTKAFYLVGRESHQMVSLEVLESGDINDLKYDLAGAFGIARPESISFHGAVGGGSSSLDAMSQLFEHREKIGIRVDGSRIREPVCPTKQPFVGNHFQIHPDHMGNHERLFQKYGSVIKTVNLGTTTYLTNDPDVAAICFSESEFFTKKVSDPNLPLHFMNDNRSLFTCDTDAPAFAIGHRFVPPSMSPRALRNYATNIHQATEKCFSVFDELDGHEQAFNLYQYMFKLAGQVILKIVLGLDAGHFKSVDEPAHEIIRTLGQWLVLTKQTNLGPPWLKYLPLGLGPYTRMKDAQKHLWNLADRAFRDCETGGGGKDMPIDECAVNSTCIADYLNRATDSNGDKMDHELRIANSTALIGAGFATTSCLYSWLIYSICHYGDAQDRLLQELVDHSGTQGQAKEWTYDEILALPYLDALVQETLRFHSPAFQAGRSSKTNVILPGGWLVPAHSVVIPTGPSVHRHKDHWENPQQFDPDRWLGGKNARAGRHRLAFLPFATGPRGCVGFNVAHIVARIVLAKLVYRYKFVDVSTEPMEYDPDFLVIRPVNVYVRAIKRTSWPKPSSSRAATATAS